MWSRRDLVRIGGLSAAGLLLPSGRVWGSRRKPRGKPDFTAAFLSDPHVYEQKNAPRGFANAVAHAFAQKRPPEFVITGGDLAFDVLETDTARADEQYALVDQGLSSVRVPVHHTLGNHDCLGVSESSGLAPSDELYGKRYFERRFGLERPYHSFDHERWHFVVLDTIGLVERRYRGFVDEEQLRWLEDDLAAANRPTVVTGTSRSSRTTSSGAAAPPRASPTASRS